MSQKSTGTAIASTRGSFYKDRLKELYALFEAKGVVKYVEECHSILQEYPNLDPIQHKCKYGYVLPDRCRYSSRTGCDCGAYPPVKYDLPF